MKKRIAILIIGLLLVYCKGSFAQSWSIAPELGANLTNYSILEPRQNVRLLTKPTGGIVVGATAQLKWSQRFCAAVGAHYTQKGYFYKAAYTSEENRIKAIELYVDALFSPSCKAQSWYIGGGAYLTQHLAGSRTVGGRTFPMEFSNQGTFGAPVSQSQDYGLRLLTMVNLTDKIYVKSVFQYGLRSLYAYNPGINPPFTVYSYGLMFTAGYHIWGTHGEKKKQK